MTSNQIAWYEAREGVRHNKEQEAIAQKSNEIEEQRLEIDKEYKERQYWLDYDYKQAYMEYLNADAEHKWIYQEKMADIEDRKSETDKYYKTLMAQYEGDKVALQASYQSDQAFYNNQKTAIERSKLGFEQSKWNEERELRQSEFQLAYLDFERRKLVDTWNQANTLKKITLGYNELQQRQNEFMLDAIKVNSENALRKSQTWSNYVSPITGLLGNTMHNGSQLLMGNLKF